MFTRRNICKVGPHGVDRKILAVSLLLVCGFDVPDARERPARPAFEGHVPEDAPAETSPASAATLAPAEPSPRVETRETNESGASGAPLSFTAVLEQTPGSSTLASFHESLRAPAS